MTPRPWRSEIARWEEIGRLIAEQRADDEGWTDEAEEELDYAELGDSPDCVWPPPLRTAIGPTEDADDFSEESFP